MNVRGEPWCTGGGYNATLLAPLSRVAPRNRYTRLPLGVPFKHHEPFIHSTPTWCGKGKTSQRNYFCI